MRFCKRPYNHLYVGKNGEARVCSWVPYSIGNVVEESIEDILNGEKRKAVIESVENDSFEYCNSISCPLLGNDSLPDISPEEYHEKINKIPNYPTQFNLAYDFICNHACPSCRSDIFVGKKDYKENINTIETKLLPYLQKAELIMASGNGDVFSSQSMLKMLSKIKPENPNCIIKLETNGSLVTREWKNIEIFEDYDIQIVVTPNSYEKETYKELSGGLDNLDKTWEGLKFLSDLRDKNKIKELKITMVVQESNFREVPSFIEKSLEEFNIDLIQIRPLMQWFKIPKATYLQKNVLNPLHPSHDEFIEVMNHPICKHPKVHHWNAGNLKRKAVPMDTIYQE